MKKKFRRDERKELFRKIQILESRIKQAEIQTKIMKEERDEAERRLMVAGTEIETIDEPVGKIQVIHPEVKIYGEYALVTEIDEIQMEKIVEELAKGIARGMIKNNMAQIIYKRQEEIMEASPLNQYSTVGMKLFVIPWEQMRTGERVEIRRLAELKRPWE